MRLGPHVTDRRSGLVINGPDADPLPQRICDMRCDQQKRYDEMKANAAIIAAAPTMLAELRNNREMLIELRDQHLNHAAAVVRALVQKRIEAADAAIARAEAPQ